LAEQIAELLVDAPPGAVQAFLAEIDSNNLTTFTVLLLKEGQKQADGRHGLDNLVDDDQCRR
jgi:hypothetical protein